MQFKNSDILQIQVGLRELVSQPMRGRLKFKLAKNTRKIEEAYKVITETLELENGFVQDTESNKEILGEFQEVEIDPFEEEELEDLEISALTVIQIAPIIKEGK